MGHDSADCGSVAQADRGYHHVEYLRGHDGLIQGITDLSATRGDLPRLDATYAYDSIHQLTGVSDARGTTTYTYDSIQNLVRREVEQDIAEGPTGAFEYGADGSGPNAITQAGDDAYAYDAAGQMQRYNGYDLRFDVEGRLVRASDPQKGITLVQHYDDSGERRIALVYHQGKPVKVHRFIAPEYQQRDGEEIWFAGAGSFGTEIVKSQGVLVDARLLDELTAYVNGQASAPKPLPEEYMDLNGDGTRLNAVDLAVAQQGYQNDQRVGSERIVFRYSTTDHLGGTTHQTDSAGELIAHQRYYVR